MCIEVICHETEHAGKWSEFSGTESGAWLPMPMASVFTYGNCFQLDKDTPSCIHLSIQRPDRVDAVRVEWPHLHPTR